MRILMTTDNIGGVWTFSIELAKGLQKMQIDVTLAITGTPLTLSQREEIRGIPFYFVPLLQEWMDNPWEDIDRAGRWLMEIAEQVRPHLIHLNSYSWGTLPWKCPVIMTLHSCVLSWWQAVRKSPPPPQWNTYRERVARGMQAATILTSPSEAMLQTAEAYYGPFKRYKIIYNGRNPLHFRTRQKQKMVFSMGRLWDEAKNIGLLFRAAREISFPVYIAGEGGSFHNEIPANVHFTGFLEPAEIAGWLSRSAVYVLPVRYEPFGYTFLEAAFSGCALVGGDVPSLREIWGEAMVYVDPDDSAGLARTIESLLNSEHERVGLAQAARLRAERFTTDEMVKGYRDLYRGIGLPGRSRTSESGMRISKSKIYRP